MKETMPSLKTPNGTTIDISLFKFDKKDLVGEVKKIAYDGEGHELKSAWLSSDNSFIIPSKGMKNHIYNTFGKPIKETIATDKEGHRLDTIPPNKLSGITLDKTMSYIDAISMDVEGTYELESSENISALYDLLKKELDENNQVYYYPFNNSTYKPSPVPMIAILIPVNETILILNGIISEPNWNKLETIPVFEEEIPEEEEEINFDVW